MPPFEYPLTNQSKNTDYTYDDIVYKHTLSSRYYNLMFSNPVYALISLLVE